MKKFLLGLLVVTTLAFVGCASPGTLNRSLFTGRQSLSVAGQSWGFLGRNSVAVAIVRYANGTYLIRAWGTGAFPNRI